MSVQTDIEMLSIQALEYYSKEHEMSEEDALEMFHHHQVFEKIILQHEYLHQLDFSETIRYVEELMKQKDIALILYHGSNILFHKIDLSKSHNRRDFGRGFYCTVLEKQAEDWAHRLYLRNFTGKEYVYSYVFHQSSLLKIKRFPSLNTEWLEFIKENRIKGGIQHSYDVVIGPVADDNIMETIQLYLSDILKPEEAVERLRYSRVNNQVSFHNAQALKYLHFESRKEISHV